MSFSDDGWGVDDDVKVAASPAKNNIEKVIEHPPLSNNINNAPQEKMNETKVFIEKLKVPEVVCKPTAIPENNIRHDPVKEVKPVEVVTVADDSDDGWGESPIKNMEIKAPVSKSAARDLKLPPQSRAPIAKPVPQSVTVPQSFDDETLDFGSPRELSPAPPVEKPPKIDNLPPRVTRSAASSRRGGDFAKPGAGAFAVPMTKSFGGPTAKEESLKPSDFGTLNASAISHSTKPVGFARQIPNEQKPSEPVESAFKKRTSGFESDSLSENFSRKFGQSQSETVKDVPKPSSGFGGAKPSSGFGGSKTSSEFGGSKPPSELGGSNFSKGFGGDQKQAEFEKTKSCSGFGGSKFVDGSGGEQLKKSSGFGSSSGYASEQKQFSGFGGSKSASGFGSVQKQSSGFGSSKTVSGSEQQMKASGFGSSSEFSSEPKHSSAFGSSKPVSGFGGEQKQSGGFGGEQKQSAGFGGSKPASGFGGETKQSGGLGVEQKQSGGFGSHQSASRFGVDQKQSGGFGGSSEFGQKQSAGFGGSSGFGDSKSGNSFGEAKKTVAFGGFSASTGGFGGKSIRTELGEGVGGEPKPSHEFGGSAVENKPSGGFGKPSSSGFGSGNSGFGGGNSGFGGGNSGFGGGNSGFGGGNSGFGGGNSGFGGDSGFAKSGSGFGQDDGGFGEREPRKSGCFNCGEEGHRKEECPNPKKPTGPCRNCNEEGHMVRDCTVPPTTACRNCNEMGHWTKDCTEPKKTFACRNCGQEGHFAKECQNERVHQEPTEPCRRCKEEGHWAFECPTRPRDLQGNILMPYDVVFVPEEEMFDDAVDNDSRINFDQKVVASMGDIIVPDMASFEGFKLLPAELHSNLKRMKMNRPTPIQRASFFPIFNGSDVVACAHTGCGKTLAFLIPLVTKLFEDLLNRDRVRDEKPSPGLLIVAPTRELANQTFNTARQLTFQTGLTCGLAYGGYSRNANLQHLNSFEKLNILVATMGRLQDFLESGDISLEKMKFVVLDEADRMVDSTDFGEEVTKILGPPEQRTSQTCLFSASFSENLQREDLPKFVKEGYTMLQVDKFGTANEKIDQHILPVPRSEKRTELCKLIGLDENTYTKLEDARIDKEKTLIFVNSVKYSDTLATFLSSCGINSIAMHSHQNQEIRDRTLEDFRKGKYQVMVASNVCARGLNIAGLDHVINYDMPDKNGFDEYVNRIGRTGRAGFSGCSTAFVDEESDREIIPGLVNILVEAKKEVPEWLANINEQAENYNEEEGDDQW